MQRDRSVGCDGGGQTSSPAARPPASLHNTSSNQEQAMRYAPSQPAVAVAGIEFRAYSQWRPRAWGRVGVRVLESTSKAHRLFTITRMQHSGRPPQRHRQESLGGNGAGVGIANGPRPPVVTRFLLCTIQQGDAARGSRVLRHILTHSSATPHATSWHLVATAS